MQQGEIGIVVSKQGEIDLMLKVIKPDVKVVLANDSPLLFKRIKLPAVFKICDAKIIYHQSFSFDNYIEG